MDYTPLPEIWEEPVEEWLAPRCGRIAAEPTRASNDGEYEDDEESTETREQESTDLLRAGLLATSFCSSPVASGLPHELRKDAHFIVRHLLYHSFMDLDLEPSEWDESAMRELLLKRMPRVLSENGRMMDTLVPVTEAFLYWLHVDGELIGADALARTVHGWADQVAAAARDSERTAPAESPVTEARKTGMDMDTGDSRIKRAFKEDLAAHPDQSTTPGEEGARHPHRRAQGEGRPQRPLPLRQRKEIQEMPRPVRNGDARRLRRTNAACGHGYVMEQDSRPVDCCRSGRRIVGDYPQIPYRTCRGAKCPRTERSQPV